MSQSGSGPQVGEALHGREAREFAERHLRQLLIDLEGWRVIWWRADPFEIWLETFPQSGAHGGGPSRLDSVGVSELSRLLEIPGQWEVCGADSMVAFLRCLVS